MKPILFNAEMTRAILDGRKTVTRRLVKPQQVIGFLPDRCKNGTPNEFIKEKPLLFLPYCNMDNNTLIESIYKSPYQVGDILYVRETFCPNYFDECIARNRNGNKNAYKADYNKDVVGDVVPEPKWHPSIHMPKEAARIFLKVTDVRVERLQDITEEQIVKEGLSPYDDICQDINWKPTYNDPDSGGDPNLKQGFEILWNTTIKEEWQEWKSNPYVWVIEFERCEKPEVAHEN